MNTDQIAQDYAQQTFDKSDKRYPQLLQDFKDAIEKATEKLRERCLDFDAEYEKGYTAGWEACDREEKLSRAAHAREQGVDWRRKFRKLAKAWRDKADEGTWDSGYVNTWIGCANELDKLTASISRRAASPATRSKP